MMDEHTVMICAPHIDGYDAIAGTKVYECEFCGGEIDIAPSGQALLAEPGVIAICIPCGMKAMEENPAPVMAPTLEQEIELEQHRRRN